MGIAVLGGMLSSTILTLLVIPVIYTIFADLPRWFSRRKKPGAHGNDSRQTLQAEQHEPEVEALP